MKAFLFFIFLAITSYNLEGMQIPCQLQSRNEAINQHEMPIDMHSDLSNMIFVKSGNLIVAGEAILIDGYCLYNGSPTGRNLANQIISTYQSSSQFKSNNRNCIVFDLYMGLGTEKKSLFLQNGSSGSISFGSKGNVLMLTPRLLNI